MYEGELYASALASCEKLARYFLDEECAPKTELSTAWDYKNENREVQVTETLRTMTYQARRDVDKLFAYWSVGLNHLESCSKYPIRENLEDLPRQKFRTRAHSLQDYMKRLQSFVRRADWHLSKVPRDDQSTAGTS